MTNTSKQIDEILDLVKDHALAVKDYEMTSSCSTPDMIFEQIRSKLLGLSKVEDVHWPLSEDGWRYRPEGADGAPNISIHSLVDILCRYEMKDDHTIEWNLINNWDWALCQNSPHFDIIAYRLPEDVKS